ncbi:MAG: bifunctional DNA-formamidopyrimidine glycosylase/DNA-(apurinic or apyrimidinic site) lyase [Limnobacter sp.]|nr:bifunctional DNA-formamidopyrimidine glycosylase/DNA-(apurinic or apyrimidinic site) lyase [Limnobacter sp.]
MPELPEVEITKRGVCKHFKEQTLLELTVRQPQLRWRIPDQVQDCVGHSLQQVQRRSKYMILDFGQQWQLVHLGMSGAIRIVDPQEDWLKHDHVQWRFETGAMRLNDPRRFGSVEWVHAEGAFEHPRLANLGLEPFSSDFTAEYLFQKTRNKKQNVKAFLLAGHAVVGVGNIYASEALFRSGIRPGKSAGRLTRQQADRLQREVQAVLAEAIDRGGSTLRDFHAIDGELGYFQLQCMVYGREGLPCKVCTSAIKKKVIGQRSTFYCPTCQQ